MNFRHRHGLAVLLLAGLAACTQSQPSPEQVREKTAEATATAKSDVQAMAEGVREGWNRNRPLDLNTASREQLQSLPDLSAAEADRIIAGRPYRKPGELLTRHILAKTEYEKIEDRVTARN
ncbi:MAG: helix-hairpin-helix domain-containing protein [Terriglobales bacterium]|jgi:DNA uptake protein ComE-like DNA-binding protein